MVDHEGVIFFAGAHGEIASGGVLCMEHVGIKVAQLEPGDGSLFTWSPDQSTM